MRHLLATSALFTALACSGSPSGNQSSSTSEGSSSVGSTASNSESSSSTSSAASSESSSANSNASSGGTSSSNGCGSDTCGTCPCGYAPNNQCLNGSWQCACAVASGTSCSSFNDSSSSGSTSSSSACGADTCPRCGPLCVNADTCGAKGWNCLCACSANSSSSSSSSSGNTSSSSGGSSTTVACNLDGGAPTLVGTWKGIASFSEMFGMGGGGGANPSDTETVVANAGGIEFQTFDTMELANCALPFTLTSATSANVVAGSSCVDTSRGQWTFQAGTATLDATGCVMTVSTNGIFADPGSGNGTFTTSATLDLQ